MADENETKIRNAVGPNGTESPAESPADVHGTSQPAPLPEWDEVYERLVSANPRIADVVWHGLGHPRDDTDKRLVMEIVERLERQKEERRH